MCCEAPLRLCVLVIRAVHFLILTNLTSAHIANSLYWRRNILRRPLQGLLEVRFPQDPEQMIGVPTHRYIRIDYRVQFAASTTR